METLSFVLGIVFIVVIALALVATYAFVKVIKVKNELDEIQRDLSVTISQIYQDMAEKNREIHQRVDLFEKEIFGQLDSRLDKLENKLINKK
jgi:putative lipase involved disintegration of autophagic bodies